MMCSVRVAQMERKRTSKILVEPYKNINLQKKLEDEVSLFDKCKYGVVHYANTSLSTIFDIGEERPGGILVLSSTAKSNIDLLTYYRAEHSVESSVFEHFRSLESLKQHIVVYNNQKFFVPIRTAAHNERWWKYRLINYLDILVDGKVFSGKYAGKTILEAREANPHENGRTNDRITMGIACNSLAEAVNLRNFLVSKIYLYVISLVKDKRAFPLDVLPWFNCSNNIPTYSEVCKVCNLTITEDIINDLMKNS